METAARFSALAHLDLPFVEFSREFCRLAARTALDAAALNSLFWIGANYHRPVDLPDTTGLSWREGPRSRTSPPSSLSAVPQSSLSAVPQSSLSTVPQSSLSAVSQSSLSDVPQSSPPSAAVSSPPAAPKSSPPVTAHSSPRARSSVGSSPRACSSVGSSKALCCACSARAPSSACST